MPKDKILIIIVDGAAQIEYKPDNIEVEIRDYTDDVEEWGKCKKDEEGDYYQEMIFPATEIKFSASGDNAFTDEPIKPDMYLNYYRHNSCDVEWEDEHSCQCDDECPVCGAAISPYRSENIETGEVTEHHDPKED
jgi:hypothetical protein